MQDVDLCAAVVNANFVVAPATGTLKNAVVAVRSCSCQLPGEPPEKAWLRAQCKLHGRSARARAPFFFIRPLELQVFDRSGRARALQLLTQGGSSHNAAAAGRGRCIFSLSVRGAAAGVVARGK